MGATPFVLEALRQPPLQGQRLTAGEMAAIARGPIKPRHRHLSALGVLRIAREIARRKEMEALNPHRPK